MTPEEIVILKKAREIQEKEKKMKKFERMQKIKREQEKQNKIKQLQLIQTLEREAIKKKNFEELLPSHLEQLQIFENEINQININLHNIQKQLNDVCDKKHKFKKSFSDKCVHVFGNTYKVGYDEYKKCIYCDYEHCVHEVCF